MTIVNWFKVSRMTWVTRIISYGTLTLWSVFVLTLYLLLIRDLLRYGILAVHDTAPGGVVAWGVFAATVAISTILLALVFRRGYRRGRRSVPVEALRKRALQSSTSEELRTELLRRDMVEYRESGSNRP